MKVFFSAMRKIQYGPSFRNLYIVFSWPRVGDIGCIAWGATALWAPFALSSEKALPRFPCQDCLAMSLGFSPLSCQMWVWSLTSPKSYQWVISSWVLMGHWKKKWRWVLVVSLFHFNNKICISALMDVILFTTTWSYLRKCQKTISFLGQQQKCAQICRDRERN
jgi:hypothetical protein